MNNNSKSNKAAFLITIFVFALCLSLLFFNFSQKGETAQVSTEGRVILSLDLSKEKDQIISLEPFGKNIELQIKDHKIRFLKSDCPNKTCVNTGFIGNEGETAVCLPNKTAITIINNKK